MKIGVPKEIKDKEGRVGLTPEAASELIKLGHEVCIEFDAGFNSGYSDQQYKNRGATLVTATEAWAADLVVKVKEPLPSEYSYLQGQIVFTFFHLAGVDIGLTNALIESGTTAIAYEMLRDELGRLPILAPMSAIAGNMAALVGSYYLAEFNSGKGVQLGSVLGQKHGNVLIVGDGVVGAHAAKVAAAMGANVTVAGLDSKKMGEIKSKNLPMVNFVVSEDSILKELIAQSDLLVGAVLCPGAKAQKVINREMVASMEAGSVIVDVSIDQGGCVETSMPTTHTQPVFTKYGVIHYCVTNMPGAYPRTSTIALVDATLPYIKKIAQGLTAFMAFARGSEAVIIHQGWIRNEAIALALGRKSSYRQIN